MASGVCVNVRTLGYRITGVQRYLLGIMRYMPRHLETVRPPGALLGIKGHLWEQFYLPTQLERRLLWSPGNTGPISVRNQVVTIHDLSSLDHSEWFERKFALWYAALLPRLIRRVRAIITVSVFSMERILDLTGIDQEKVYVIHNGVDEKFHPVDPELSARVRKDLGLESPYILFVGSLDPRKNLATLLRAWEAGSFDGATLAIVGASGHMFPKMKIASVPKGVRLLGSVDDELMPALYGGASGFVYPSLYEGFGMPPLEAMACGCPVAVSRIPAHREVCGETALYFEPFAVEEIAMKLEYLLGIDDVTRKSLVEKGLERTARYTWQGAAQKTWHTLNMATNH